MFQRQVQRYVSIATVLASLPLVGCVNEPTETIDEILNRYEQEGALQFLAPIDPESGEASDLPTRDVFHFLSAEAEERFRDELDFESPSIYPEVTLTSSSSDWICNGESTHAVDNAHGLVGWVFLTVNNSTRTKRVADVKGTVFHPSGWAMSCEEDSDASKNSCSIFTNIASGYNSSAGHHRCCEKKGLFGSYDCSATFGTADAL